MRFVRGSTNLAIWASKGRQLLYPTAGLYAGLLLATLESIERSAALHDFAISFWQRLHLVIDFSLTVCGTVVLALVIGLLRLVGRTVERHLSKRLKPFVSAAVMTFTALLILSGFPAVIRTFHLLVENISEKLIPLGYLLQASSVLFAACLYIAFLTLVWVEGQLEATKYTAGPTAASLAIACALISAAFYFADAKISVGRYFHLFHFPAALCATFFALLFGILLVCWLSYAVLTVTLLALQVCITAYAVARFDSDPVVKSLFWTRGVLAKKYVYIVHSVFDRDDDGFSAILSGGDCSGIKSDINPLARDPLNGIDENCNGIEAMARDLFAVPAEPLPAVARNAILVTIDCLRADHLGSYGYSRATSPKIDEFAARAVIFERAFSAGTNTGHTFSSIARSAVGEAIFDDSLPTLAESFATSGYLTVAITSPGTEKWLNKRDWKKYKEIMTRGFQVVLHRQGGYWNSRKLTDEALGFLQANSSKPFYLWLHYNDLHAKSERYVLQAEGMFGSSDVDIYDANLRFTDEHLGRLFEYLLNSGLLNTTAVIISADHGEEFGENGQKFHNGRPSKVQTHVPLILWYPGVQPQRVSQPVSSIDIAPTLLKVAGISLPAGYLGLDLRLIADGKAKGRVVFCETPRNVPDPDFFAWAVIDDRWRLIYDRFGNTWELYDELTDPLARKNLVSSRQDLAESLKEKLAVWMDLESRRPDYKYWSGF
ncbi:MAG: sulfatase [Acidobacteriota bacterium]|nr:sulfatase-like hydrolase/transferase [Blastocatellia bacterium]MDW8412471.1 sulfatase [Acidobacteriota bacterium]